MLQGCYCIWPSEDLSGTPRGCRLIRTGWCRVVIAYDQVRLSQGNHVDADKTLRTGWCRVVLNTSKHALVRDTTLLQNLRDCRILDESHRPPLGVHQEDPAMRGGWNPILDRWNLPFQVRRLVLSLHCRRDVCMPSCLFFCTIIRGRARSDFHSLMRTGWKMYTLVFSCMRGV